MWLWTRGRGDGFRTPPSTSSASSPACSSAADTDGSRARSIDGSLLIRYEAEEELCTACSGRSCILGAGNLVGRHEPALRGARRASPISEPSRSATCHSRAAPRSKFPLVCGPPATRPATGSCPSNLLRASIPSVPTDRKRTVESAAGLYPPLAYMLPGAVARLASNPQSADRAGRLVLVAISSILFVLASLLLWSPEVGYVSLLGLIAAMTPMVIFVSSMLSNSALETAAGLTFAAAIVRLARPGAHRPWVWAVQLRSGGLLTVARTTGILWMTFGVALYCILVGLSGIRESVRVSRSPLIGAATVLVAAAVANRAWEATYGTEVARRARSPIPGWTRSAKRSRGCPVWAASGSGHSGGSTRGFREPRSHVAWAWGSDGRRGGRRGRPRQRCTPRRTRLGADRAVLLSATLRAGELGGNVQARHLMPFLVVIPLLAGEIIAHRGCAGGASSRADCDRLPHGDHPCHRVVHERPPPGGWRRRLVHLLSRFPVGTAPGLAVLARRDDWRGRPAPCESSRRQAQRGSPPQPD